MMRDWEDEFGSEKPTPEAILLRLRERFPGIQSVVMFREDDDGDKYAVVQQGQYQKRGFRIRMSDDYMKYHGFESGMRDALKGKLQIVGRMKEAPGAEPGYNPNADRDITDVLTFEANEYMLDKRAKTFKAVALTSGCGMRLVRSDPYADATPPAQLVADLRAHLQTLFNVTVSDLDAENQATFDVIPYEYKDNRAELDAQRKVEGILLDDGAREEYIEEYICRKGALTPIRHGWIAGYTGAAHLREFRVMHEEGGATYLVPGSSAAPSRAVARDILELRELTNVGHQTEEWLYTRCLPDIVTEDLLAQLRLVHAEAAGKEERETFSSLKRPPVEGSLMPKPVMALRVGDRFGTKAVGSAGSADDICHWCEVKSVDENTLTAEVLNGRYEMQYDLITGIDLGVPSHDVKGGSSVIFFTADNPVQHSFNYGEGIEYMREAIDAQNGISATSGMDL